MIWRRLPSLKSLASALDTKVHRHRKQRRLAMRSDTTCPKARDEDSSLHMLVIDARTPTPDMDSGSVDCFEYLGIFKRLGIHVTFLPEDLAHCGRYTEDLQELGIECLHRPCVDSVADAIGQLAERIDVVLVYRARTADWAIDIVRARAPRAKIIFDTVDLHFLREQREAELLDSDNLRRRAAETKRIELAAMRKCDATIVLSHYEMNLVKQIAPEIDCHRIPIVRDVPGRSDTPWDGRQDLMFIGGYEHAPNVDAVKYFVTEVWPLLRELQTGARFLIAGSNMPRAVKRLAAHDIIVKGFVPDLSAAFDRVRLTVAPLRYGAGIKGKVVSSLSHGVPCIASSLAIEGSELESGVHVLTADEPREMAALIARAYCQPELWNRLSDQGLEICRKHYSVAAVTQQLSSLLSDLGLDRTSGS